MSMIFMQWLRWLHISQSEYISVRRSILNLSLSNSYCWSIIQVHSNNHLFFSNHINCSCNVESIIIFTVRTFIIRNDLPKGWSGGWIKPTCNVYGINLPTFISKTSAFCHSPTQPQHEFVLDLIMGRKPPYSHSVLHLITVVYCTRNF